MVIGALRSSPVEQETHEPETSNRDDARGGDTDQHFAGLGAASVASTQTGTDAADAAYRGVASGVLNSAAQVGTAVGVALLLPLAAAIGLDTMSGYRIGFIGAGVVALGGALASLLVPTARSRSKSPQWSEIPSAQDPATVDNSASVGNCKR